MKLIVTFDGPVACGKSTLAKKVAQRVDYIYLSTGLLYRAIAYRVRDMGLESLSDNENTMFHIAKCQHYRFKNIDSESRLFLNGVDRTDEVKNDSLSLLASTVSRYQRIRNYLLEIQRRVARDGGVIAEGRDTGRIVFPKAHLKFWLTADVSFRVKMRQRDLVNSGKTIFFRGSLSTNYRERRPRYVWG